MNVIFFWKCSKFNADSKNAEKNPEKIFCFWDKCIWIVCIQLSLLITEYLSSTVNVLKKQLKNFHVSNSDFCNSIIFRVITQDDKRALINIESVLLSAYHVAFQGVLSNGSFYTFIYGRFSWSLISEIHKPWASYFFKNVRKLMQIRKMQKKIQKESFVFEINASELFAFNCRY